MSDKTFMITRVFNWFVESYLPLSPIFLTIFLGPQSFCLADSFFSTFDFGFSATSDSLLDSVSDSLEVSVDSGWDSPSCSLGSFFGSVCSGSDSDSFEDSGFHPSVLSVRVR